MQDHPFGRDVLNAAASVAQAREWSTALEDREAKRTGEGLTAARKAVANRVSVPPGTLENLRKRRLKAIAVHLFERIRGGLIRELHAEIVRLEHEAQLLTATGTDPRSNEIAAVVADLAKARQALGMAP